MCRDPGLVIAALMFSGWRNSEKPWQRILVWIAGIWGGISLLFYFLLIVSGSFE